MKNNVRNQNKVRTEAIFDRIMKAPILCRFQSLLKNREMLLYLFFGFLSFLVSIGTYALFTEILHVNVLIANVFAWILSVSFAYITNRIWVFESSAENRKSILQEISKFITGRLISLAVEEMILYVFINKLEMNSMTIKILATIVVIVLNYFVSKAWVFSNTNG